MISMISHQKASIMSRLRLQRISCLLFLSIYLIKYTRSQRQIHKPWNNKPPFDGTKTRKIPRNASMIRKRNPFKSIYLPRGHSFQTEFSENLIKIRYLTKRAPNQIKTIFQQTWCCMFVVVKWNRRKKMENDVCLSFIDELSNFNGYVCVHAMKYLWKYQQSKSQKTFLVFYCFRLHLGSSVSSPNSFSRKLIKVKMNLEQFRFVFNQTHSH